MNFKPEPQSHFADNSANILMLTELTHPYKTIQHSKVFQKKIP